LLARAGDGRGIHVRRLLRHDESLSPDRYSYLASPAFGFSCTANVCLRWVHGPWRNSIDYTVKSRAWASQGASEARRLARRSRAAAASRVSRAAETPLARISST